MVQGLGCTVWRKVCPLAYAIEGECEALGQLGQDEPASG